MSTQPYRAAIVGLGSIARAHLRGYRRPQNGGRVEVIAGADVSAEARDRFASEAGIEPPGTPFSPSRSSCNGSARTSSPSAPGPPCTLS